MKNRLIQALQAVGRTIHERDGTEPIISGIPEKIQTLAARISPSDYRLMFVLLMKYENISAEWIIRGKGEMLIEEGSAPTLKQEIEKLQVRLDHEIKKVRALELGASSDPAPKKRGRPRKY
jgi:hypothetical protein